jgi:DNA-binding NarL/FixJ family response regulator
MKMKLTPREIEVSLLVADGLTNKEIAKQLNVSVYTVKSHIHNIFATLGIVNRVELLKYVKVKGIG